MGDGACKCIACLVERSSFGTPAAKAARASVTDEQVARVLERARELEAQRTTDPCRVCGCERDDHNDPRQGGGCTACGDCEGWL